MGRALRHPVATLVATARVFRAAARVGWHEPRTTLPELVAKLRSAPPSPTELNALNALIIEGVLETLLPLLPPFGAGRCVKRSYAQLDLWARAGLEPRLHIGFWGSGSARQGHVWVTTQGAQVEEGLAETWSA